MNGRPWTKRDHQILRRRYPNEPTSDTAAALGRSVRAVYAQATLLGLRKSAKYLASPAAHRCDGRKGMATRFTKGHKPWNAGKKGWKAGGRSAETRFKKGHKPQTWVPVGTEVVDPDGYLKRKIADDAVPSRFNWQFVHVLVWEEANGPRPPGHTIVFKDGNKRNVALDNLECISRAELMRRNTVHNYPKPLAQAIQLRGALKRQINRRQKGQDEKQDRRLA